MAAIFCLALVPFVFIYLWVNRQTARPVVIEEKKVEVNEDGSLNTVLGYVRTEAKRIDENDPQLRLTEKRGTGATSPTGAVAAAILRIDDNPRTPLLAAVAAPVSTTHGTLQGH
jgi:hypothetical protein